MKACYLTSLLLFLWEQIFYSRCLIKKQIILSSYDLVLNLLSVSCQHPSGYVDFGDFGPVFVRNISRLLKVTDDIRHGLHQKMATILVLLDFTKAFDRVDMLFRNLMSNLIVNYLYGRSSRVSLDDVL